MDVFIDNDEFATQSDTLAGIIEDARREVAPSGRIVVEVRLDGRSIPDHELSQYQPMLGQAEELQLITACPMELSTTTLREIESLLADTRGYQQDAAAALTEDDTAAALNHVREALAGWQQAQEAVQTVAALLSLPLDQLQVGDQLAPAVIDELAAALTHVREQLVNSDWVALADTLGYELEQAAEKWQAMIGVLIAEIQCREQHGGA